MDLSFSPELQAKLDDLAARCGRDPRSLVSEAVERFVEYDAWFAQEVEQGLAASGRGELIEHDEIAKLIERRYPG